MHVILHCSDSSFGNAATIALWHGLPKENGGRGWSAIGYHFIILNGKLGANVFNRNFDGHVETGRPIDDNNLLEPFEIGAHTIGMNRSAIGICFIGKSNDFTKNQFYALENEILPMLKKQFSEIVISQHSDHEPKKPFCAGLTKIYINGLNQKFGQ